MQLIDGIALSMCDSPTAQLPNTDVHVRASNRHNSGVLRSGCASLESILTPKGHEN
jgi:hypothetical protein